MKQNIGVTDILPNKEIKNIEKIVLALLKDSFKDIDIIDVHIKNYETFDDDFILNVTVIFKGKLKGKSNIVGNAIKKVRDKLSEQNIFAFPMLSFMSEKDARKYAV